jgi:hypothetical protein
MKRRSHVASSHATSKTAGRTGYIETGKPPTDALCLGWNEGIPEPEFDDFAERKTDPCIPRPSTGC